MLLVRDKLPLGGTGMREIGREFEENVKGGVNGVGT